MKTILPHSIGTDLRAVCHKYGEPFSKQKSELMQQSLNGRFNKAASLIAFYDALLFIRAYPETKTEYKLAGQALEAIKAQLAEEKRKGNSLPEKLNGTGLPESTLSIAPSLDLLESLRVLFHDELKIDSTNADAETVTAILKLFLPQSTHEYLEEKNKTLAQRAQELAGNENPVDWLIRLFRDKNLPADITDQLFNSLGAYFSITHSADTFSKAELQHPFTQAFFNPKGLQKKADELKILNQKIDAPLRLSETEKQWYIAVSRLKLALLNRETDPVTYCNEEDVHVYAMGRGFQIALFGLKAERRLPFDSYIGYMAFKNGLPIAYGGAWMFGAAAKIGVNIFEEFRGGESAWIFCQLMRLYRQLYDVKRFIVEPYQYGKHNPEGIQSGAFWFYYRLGFRPANEKLNAVGAAEWKKIQADKSYRSPAGILRSFTHSNIEFAIDKNAPASIDPSGFSKLVTKLYSELGKEADEQITREIASVLNISLKSWNANELAGFTRLAPLLFLIPDLKSWNAKAKKELTAILKSRGGETEMEYCKRISRHQLLLDSLKGLLEKL